MKEKDKKKDKIAEGEIKEPLTEIIKKEKELKYLLQEAEEKAEQIIMDARLKAGDIKRSAYSEEEIKKMYEDEIKEAKEEAERIRSQSEEEVSKVQKKAEKNINDAVELIIKSIIPL